MELEPTCFHKNLIVLTAISQQLEFKHCEHVDESFGSLEWRSLLHLTNTYLNEIKEIENTSLLVEEQLEEKRFLKWILYNTNWL